MRGQGLCPCNPGKAEDGAGLLCDTLCFAESIGDAGMLEWLCTAGGELLLEADEVVDVEDRG